jgi:respiratory nitrate reductase gamma subunit
MHATSTSANWLLAGLCYFSAAVFAAGMLLRFSKWWRAGSPVKLVLTPASKTTSGVVRRVTSEMIFFPALLKSGRCLWAAAWLFHASLLLLVVGHAGGLVFHDLTCRIFGLTEKGYHHFANVTGGIFGLTAMAALIILLLRRLVLERVRYISGIADYTALALLLLVIGAGNIMRFFGGFNEASLAQARAFVRGLLAFQPVAAPANAVFHIHLILVCLLLIYFPFSKLVHLGAAAFNPTLNQANNPREKRHIGPWDAGTQNNTKA